jgi:hypothetical protein
MSTDNEAKSLQLGMPFGTASNKLRKLILFDLVTKYEGGICYRCFSKIETVDEFSIEHKNPWFGVSSNLFWDLENIAFSHISCNTRAARREWGKNKYAPANTAWCSFGKHYTKIEHFWRSKSRKSGLNANCKIHGIEKSDISRRKRGLRPSEPKFKRGSKYDSEGQPI